MSFLCISSDSEKLTVFAYTSENSRTLNDIKANDWVSKTLEAVGGRGGGKPEMAQGSVANPDSVMIEKALMEAKKYLIDSKLMV